MNYLWLLQVIIAYLLGMAFAGSFIGRKWMGLVDITLHKLLQRKVKLTQYLYWKYFCGIENPPKPEGLKKTDRLVQRIMGLLASLRGID